MMFVPTALLRKSGGFSLVEVAMAMAIVSFTLVSILGLLPMGLSNFRQAMNTTVESQIVQGLTSELRLTSFQNLANGTTYYDADGNALTSSVGAIYTATTTFGPVAGTSYPVNLTANADAVTIVITNKTQPGPGHTYTFILANQNN